MMGVLMRRRAGDARDKLRRVGNVASCVRNASTLCFHRLACGHRIKPAHGSHQ